MRTSGLWHFTHARSSTGWTSRGKSATSKRRPEGSISLGLRASACETDFVRRTVFAVLRSWQPTHPCRSPGITCVKLCIRLTARPPASTATKKRAFRAGAVKYALPSASTGTQPSRRGSANDPPNVSGSMPPEKLIGLGSTSNTMSRLTVPGFTPCMLRLSSTFSR